VVQQGDQELSARTSQVGLRKIWGSPRPGRRRRSSRWPSDQGRRQSYTSPLQSYTCSRQKSTSARFKTRSRMAPHRPASGSRRAARAARPTDVTGWCVSAGGSEPQRCSRSRGCAHAPGAAEYCTLVGGAIDVGRPYTSRIPPRTDGEE
jgi:hypothetical protein